MSVPAGPHRTTSSDAWRRALEMTAPIESHPETTLPALVEEWADKFGTTLALRSEHEALTYRDLADRTNRYARWALAQGLKRGDAVAMVMPNCADYMAMWLGLTRVGCVVSLVNPSLVGKSLEHAIRLVAPRQIVAGAEQARAVAAALPHLGREVGCWAHGASSLGLPRIEDDIARLSGDRLQATESRPPSLRDMALYLYTSGTTGLPKAAPVSHYRVMQWSHWFAGMLDIRPADRIYDCLPMYHSVGGIVATGSALVAGGCVVIRERFSANRFWDDIAEEKCSIFQYIGELCRYLVNAPPHPREGLHQLRLCCGNGMGREVWEALQRRFHIPQILEFYAATEANFSLYNCNGRPGAIGRIPGFLVHRFPVALIKLDADTAEPLRDEQGLCIRCSADEIGEAVSRIPKNPAQLNGRFEGYTDPEASALKILRNVFRMGDAWYRSGDLMRQDTSGYFYFVDRIGDTFRWKGENVSTTEVAEAIAACPGIVEAAVCGVAIPGIEGRAGLAAIIAGNDFDPARLHAHLASRLPPHAQPLFLRVCSQMELTATFKLQKQRLAREGCDPAAIADALYLNDRRVNAFVPLDVALYRAIQEGRVRP
jgi:fatty-acyl-CoA synthase